jgi:hypothetical protein
MATNETDTTAKNTRRNDTSTAAVKSGSTGANTYEDAFAVSMLARLTSRAQRIQQTEIREVLVDLMETEIEENMEDEAARLAEMLHTTTFFRSTTIGSSLIYFLIRDILRMRGHDIRHISTRAIRIEIASYLYSDEIDGS